MISSLSHLFLQLTPLGFDQTGSASAPIAPADPVAPAAPAAPADPAASADPTAPATPFKLIIDAGAPVRTIKDLYFESVELC